MQETLLTAWQSLGGFERRASVRTWLYRVATSRYLNALRATSRRPQTDWPLPGVQLPEPTRVGEVIWLEPYPDALLANAADTPPGPEARYEATEAMLTDDVRMTMPPVPLEYEGRELAPRFHAAVTFRQGRTYRLVAIRANGQPAYCGYFRDPASGVLHATGLVVHTLAGDRICAMTRFDNSVLPSFGLPRTLPG